MPTSQVRERKTAQRPAPRRTIVRRAVAADPVPPETTADEVVTIRRWPVAVLAILLLATFAGAAVAGHGWYQRNRLDAAHQEALAAARQLATDFVSISASTVDRDLQRISSAATGEFKDQFTQGLTQVRSAVVDNKVESQGQVLRSGLVSGDLDSAVVLVAVDASVKNVRAPDGRISHYRIQVDLNLDRASKRWLASKLQFVG
jgi:Mce-associated membrane protein